jgi:hypothetical protein
VDESLEVYYCAYCGAHSLILDVLVSELPLRSSDGARVVQLAKHATQLLLDEGPAVKIKRAPGKAGGPALVEKQYRYVCKGCGLPLAYLSFPFKDPSNKLLYLIADAFALTPEGKTKAQLDAEEAARRDEEASLAPIVIPKFAVTKPSAAALAAAAAAQRQRETATATDAASAASKDSDAAAAAPAASTTPADQSASASSSSASAAPGAVDPSSSAGATAPAPAAASAAPAPTAGTKREREE